MNSILVVLIIVSISLLSAYSIKRFFDFKISQGKETSNAPIRMAIGSLAIAFLAIVGFAPFIAGIIVQLLNHIPGIALKETQNSETISAIAFVAFCMAIVGLIYLYYRHRSGLYSKNKKESSGDLISGGKNVVNRSSIHVGGNIQIGDSTNNKKK